MKKQKKTIKKALKQQNRKKQKRFYKNLTKQKGGSMKKQNLIKNNKTKSGFFKIPNLIKSLKTGKSLILTTSHHDQFFKRFFSQISYAKELLKLILSPKELAQCDLKSLKVEKRVSKTNRMDLILSFYFKHLPYKQIKILVLVEHKSKYDKKLWFMTS